MFIADCRDAHTGFWPLQSPNFRDRGFSLSFREMLGGARVERKSEWPEGFGQPVYDRDSVGDIHGGQLWKRSRDDNAREIPMWRWATPVKTREPPEDANIDPPNCTSLQDELFFSPVRESNENQHWLPDDRLERFQIKNPSCDEDRNIQEWNTQPAGIYGISLVTNQEDEQVNLFLPTDPRLISATAGDPSFSTRLCDVEDFSIATPCREPDDIDRVAPFNGFARVVPTGPDRILRGPCTSRGPAIALQGVISPCGRVGAGFLAFERNGIRNYTGAAWPEEFSGILSPGYDEDDKHLIFHDADGNPFNSLHLHTNAYWVDLEDEDKKRDGPFKFDGDFSHAVRGDTPCEVELLWDNSLEHEHCSRVPKEGKWRWVAYCNEDDTTTSSPGDSSPGDPHWIPPIDWADGSRRNYIWTANEKGFPGILARPQLFNTRAPDYRYILKGKTQEDRDWLREYTPIGARLESIGYQAAESWEYKKEPGDISGRYPTPTVNGAFVLTSPDVGVEDFVLSQYDSTDDNAEGSLLVAPDSAFLKFGTPDLDESELLADGWIWSFTSTDNRLNLSRKVDGSASAVEVYFDATEMNVDKDVVFGADLVIDDSGELTMAAAAITVTGSRHNVTPQIASTVNDLNTISGGRTGMILILRKSATPGTVRLKDGAGNIQLAGSDVDLDTEADRVMLDYDGTNWNEIARSNNS